MKYLHRKWMKKAAACAYILSVCLTPWAMAETAAPDHTPDNPQIVSETTAPTAVPTAVPTAAPTAAPTPTAAVETPASAPTATPVPAQTETADPVPEGTPVSTPDAGNTPVNTPAQTQDPGSTPGATTDPGTVPTVDPAATPSAEPTAGSTTEPTTEPTTEATTEPTAEPTLQPTPSPQEVDEWLRKLTGYRTYADYLAALKEQLTAYQQSALLPALVSRLESGRYAQFEDNVEESLRAEIIRRMEDGSITEASLLAYYRARRETDILAFISELTEGAIELGNISWGSNSLKTGDTIVLAVPIVFTPASGQNHIYSNVAGGSYVRHAGQFNVYDDDLCGYLSYVRVDIDAGADNFPFRTPDSTSYTLLGRVSDNYGQWGLTYDGETGLYSGMEGSARVNGGFALFRLKVDKDLYTGNYPVNFTVSWTNAQTGRTSTTQLSTNVYIKGKSQYTGGGGYYGGGGGTVSPTLSPSTKLYVESISTDPEDVSAGDTFDLVISIRNTSLKKYVQNMKVTVTAADDAILPVSGSSTVYVSRIEPDSTYELRMPVKAKLDLPDEPLKIDVSLEYEDSEVTALSAGQTLVLQVAQVNRLTVSEPSLPTEIPEAGDTYRVTLQLVNQGRTTLYNVTVTAESDNEQLLSPLPYFVGNLEGGSSHKAEIDLVPLSEGLYDVTFNVTYENAQGQEFSMDPQIGSFYAQPVEEYDYGDYTYDEPADETEEKAAAMGILQKMPWWLYGAVGALVVCMISLASASAHARRRKALEDDEME